MTCQLAVEYRPIGNLAAFSSNARSHSKHQIRQIAASIEQFGFTNPVLIDNKNTIIAGHGESLPPSFWAWNKCPRFDWKV